MDNAFLTWLKSAVIFGVIFGLSGCDKLNSSKSTNTATEEPPKQSQSIEQENTSKPSRTLLTRAFYSSPFFWALVCSLSRTRELITWFVWRFNRLWSGRENRAGYRRKLGNKRQQNLDLYLTWRASLVKWWSLSCPRCHAFLASTVSIK